MTGNSTGKESDHDLRCRKGDRWVWPGQLKDKGQKRSLPFGVWMNAWFYSVSPFLFCFVLFSRPNGLIYQKFRNQFLAFSIFQSESSSPA